MSDFEDELKEEFLEESEDLLIEAEESFLKLEDNRDDPELINQIFRLAHNLKGTSQAVGLDQLSEVTHIAENLILKLKEGSKQIDDEVVTVLLLFKDKITEMIEGLKADLSATFEVEEIKRKINAVISSENSVNEEEKVEDIIKEEKIEEVIPSSESFENEIECIPTADELNDSADDFDPSLVSEAALESLRESGFDEEVIASLGNQNSVKEDPEVQPSEVISLEKQETKVKAKEASAHKNSENDESIRVKLSRIDKINNVIGELVILQTVLGQKRYTDITDDLANKSIGMMGKLFKEVQEIAMSLRMLPLKSNFQKMSRIVRDTSKLLNKKVNLHIIGEETEVDKTILQKISDPLVHIVRNAVDHGLETTEERIAAGKSEVGDVELMAFHEGSNLVIQVTDDGKGIDPEKIKAKAIQKGIITENTNMSNMDIIQLVFHPGFSTKEEVTEVSGRGVGMDVVKTNIESLGGEVKVMSKIGTGSSFKIVLPLTLAIIEGIIINAEDESYVIPLSQIFELTRARKEDIEEFSSSARLLKLRGEVIPLFNLNDKLGKKVEEKDDQVVMIVRSTSQTYGVIVDDVVNQQQIVIKKLGEDIANRKGIMGSAIMADGKPSVILDLFELFKDEMKTSKAYKKLNQDFKEAV